jgi:hypothetical protein
MALLSMADLYKKYGKKPEKQKEALSKELKEVVEKMNNIKKLLEVVDKKCGEKLTRTKKK